MGGAQVLHSVVCLDYSGCLPTDEYAVSKRVAGAAVTVYDGNAPAESKPVAPPSKPKAAAAGAALMTLLSQLPTLPMQLGQPEADAPTLNLLYVALEAPVQYDPKDVEKLIKPLLLACQRCAGHQQLTMRLAFLLVSVVRLLHRRARLVPHHAR
jgi:hypothetical protein